MDNYAFIFETDDVRKKRIRTLVTLLSIAFLGATIVAITSATGIITIPSVGKLTDISTYAPNTLTIALIAAAGGIFFITLPLELLFLGALANTTANPVSLAIGLLTGFLIGNIVSYFIGWKLSSTFAHLISPKKIYSMRRWVNKNGAKAVFLCNLLPLPGPILTFALGIARYNMTRLFVVFSLACIIKYGILVLVGYYFL